MGYIFVLDAVVERGGIAHDLEFFFHAYSWTDFRVINRREEKSI
jgi:hypothetical protein